MQRKIRERMALNGFLEFFQKGKTFRPKKRFSTGTIRYSLHKQAQASLQSGINLRQVVRLPEGENMNDWLAVHVIFSSLSLAVAGTGKTVTKKCELVCNSIEILMKVRTHQMNMHKYTLHMQVVVDFFNRINLIYGTVSEYCSGATCPVMSGGSRYEYLWADGENYKKPTHLPAPRYVELLMDWIESQINNETVFPVSTDVPFPKTFLTLCRKILTRLFRVFVHVYIHHFDRIVSIGAEAHVNTCYKHFYYFVQEFDLISSKELEPLVEMTSKICKDS